MKINKKAQLGANLSFAILGVIFLIIGLFIYAIFMPTALPFINMILEGDSDPLTKFLFASIPFMTIIGVAFIASKT